jgi:hypothetical protein
MRALLAALLMLVLALPLGRPSEVLAAPVSWVEVPPTAEGRQWWDEGSLRISRGGYLTVLSRFQPAAAPADAGAAAPAGAGEAAPTARAPLGSLYVMELDCDQDLYRDISVNGLPRFSPPWQPTGRDDLTHTVLQQACAAYSASLAPAVLPS